MRLTHQEKLKLLESLSDEISEELLCFLKRRYSVTIISNEFSNEPRKLIDINGKFNYLESNKKNITNKICNLVEDRWIFLGTPKIRKTIKYFLNRMIQS